VHYLILKIHIILKIKTIWTKKSHGFQVFIAFIYLSYVRWSGHRNRRKLHSHWAIWITHTSISHIICHRVHLSSCVPIETIQWMRINGWILILSMWCLVVNIAHNPISTCQNCWYGFLYLFFLFSIFGSTVLKPNLEKEKIIYKFFYYNPSLQNLINIKCVSNLNSFIRHS
jgi:hypothetical protein